MWEWIKKWWNGLTSLEDDWKDGDDNDELQEAVIQRCWESGNVVIANRNDDGSVTIQEFPSGQSDSENTGVAEEARLPVRGDGEVGEVSGDEDGSQEGPLRIY